MKRQTLLAWLGAAVALSGLGSASGFSSSNVAAAGLPAARTESLAGPSFYYNFEATLGPWKSVTDTREGTSLVRAKGDDGCLDAGNYFANLQSASINDTRPAKGGIPQPVGTWMLLNLPTVSGPAAVHVEWAASSRYKSCAGCVVAAYAGASAPAYGGQFRQAGVLPAVGWKNYKADFKLTDSTKSSLYVAIGWQGIDASIGIDCVNVTIISAKSDN